VLLWGVEVCRFAKLFEMMAGSPLKTLVADHPPRLVVRYVPGADGTNAVAAATLAVAPAITAIVGEIACPVFPGPAQYLGKFILLLEENLKMRLVSADIFRNHFFTSVFVSYLFTPLGDGIAV
jgi:hypothetical protein